MKRSIDDLALLGGRSLFAEPRHVGRPVPLDRAHLLARIRGVLERDRWTNDGPLVREFEERVAAIAGTRYCVAMTNGTLALELALRAVGFLPGLVVSAFTFIATAHAARNVVGEAGLTFADVDPETHNLDPACIKPQGAVLGAGICPTHVWGRPCDTDNIEQAANRMGGPVVYDAAHAFGCTHKGRPIGAYGQASIFSFHATKVVSCGEGGALVTNDTAVADRARLYRNFGFIAEDCVADWGTNAKMSELAAALGLTSLEAMGETVATNHRQYQSYRRHLSGLQGVRLVAYDEQESNNYQYLVLDVEGATTGLTRDVLWRVLKAENVLARRYFYPCCHRSEPYASSGRYGSLPVAEALSERVLVLPTGASISEEDVERICEVLHFSVRHASAITARLRGGRTVMDEKEVFAL